MAGLLAWAADVVGGSGQLQDEETNTNRFSAVVFTPEQQKYALELDHRASALRRSIQDLRLRLPPPDISQRLPHLHAHSIASSADLALQLTAHSSTRQEAQLREITLQEENAVYEKAISNCQKKMQEKLQEADILQTKLQELDTTEKNLRSELERTQAALEVKHYDGSLSDSKPTGENQEDTTPQSDILEKLDAKKKELSSIEERLEDLEKSWAMVQHNSTRQPSPAQREKTLDKQLHSLIEQLAAKQAQAESLASDIHVKGRELEKLNSVRRGLDNGNVDLNATRNRFGRSSSGGRFSSADFNADHLRPYAGARIESQQRLMLLRSAFVLYILVLHVLVFMKLSF